MWEKTITGTGNTAVNKTDEKICIHKTYPLAGVGVLTKKKTKIT